MSRVLFFGILMSSILAPPAFGGNGHCDSILNVVDLYRSYMETPDINRGQVDRYLDSFQKAAKLCPGNEKRFLRDLNLKSTDELKANLVSHWVHGREVGASDLTSTVSPLVHKDLVPYNLAPALRAQLEKEVARAEAENKSRLDAIDAIPAAKCTDTHNVGKLPPLLIQGQTGACASFMTADLLSLETGGQVSAFSLLVGLGKYEQGTNRETLIGDRINDWQFMDNADLGAAVWEPLLSASRTGFCYESDFSSNLNRTLGRQDASDVVGLMRKTTMGDLPENPRTCNATSSGLRQLFPSTDLSDFNGVYKQGYRSTAQVAFDGCKKKTSVDLKKFRFDEFPLDQDQDLKKRLIDQALDHGGIVGTALSSRLYKSQDNAGARPNHAVSIVDRRTNPKTGACEYLVRNSLGDAKKKDPPVYESAGEGHDWIPETVLLKSIRDLLSKKVEP